MDERLSELLEAQSGVVSRRQSLRAGLTPENVDRLRRRNELATVHPGVYVAHTGEPTWAQYAWAAVLLAWPAVLSGSSAMAAVEGPESPHRRRPIEIVVAKDRRIEARAGIRLRRSAHAPARTVPGSPPRIRYEEAVLDVVAPMTTVDQVVAELGRVVQSRRTTAPRLLAALDGRECIRQRNLLVDVLGDVAAGVCSALERSYLHDVERGHGLPAALRQSRERTARGVVFRDAVYVLGVRRLVVELDGRLFHDTTGQRNDDYERDLVVRLRGDDTVRLSWKQVRGSPCWTAGALGQLLQGIGWQDAVRPCGPGCALARPVGPG